MGEDKPDKSLLPSPEKTTRLTSKAGHGPSDNAGDDINKKYKLPGIEHSAHKDRGSDAVA